MARTRLTARKSTGGRVPRHQLASRDPPPSDSSDSSTDNSSDGNGSDTSGGPPSPRTYRLMKNDLRLMLTDNINMEVQLYHMAGYVVNLEAYTNILHEEVHQLQDALNPPEAPEAAEEGPVVIQVDSDTSEDEAEEPGTPTPDEGVTTSESEMDDD